EKAGTWADLQEADPDLRLIRALKATNMKSPDWHEVAGCSQEVKSFCNQFDRLIIKEGALYRRYEDVNSGSTILQIGVPKAQRNEFVKEVHRSIGHFGQKRTA